MNSFIKITANFSFTLFLCVLLAGCLSSTTQMGTPEAKTVATGSSAGSSAQGTNSALERCYAPLGTVSFHEDKNETWYRYLTRDLRLTSTVPVLRLLAQQSNCFVVVERGEGMDDVMKERELMQRGELRGDSNFQKGQMVAADYTIIPTIIFSQRDSQGLGAIAGGVFGHAAGAIAGGIRTSDASTLLTLIDNRSSVQLAVAEGSARTTDWNILGGLLGGHAGLGIGAYTKTAQGKTIVAAFTDSMNNLIKSLKSYKAQNVSGGLGAGGLLEVQGSNSQYNIEGVITKREYNTLTKEYDYEIINKERTKKWDFSSRQKILYKDDLIRFNVINSTPEIGSFIKIESNYKQKNWD